MEVHSYEFGKSLIMGKLLDTFAKCGWFVREDVSARGETMPKPRKDEVVLFREFFSTRLPTLSRCNWSAQHAKEAVG